MRPINSSATPPSHRKEETPDQWDVQFNTRAEGLVDFWEDSIQFQATSQLHGSYDTRKLHSIRPAGLGMLLILSHTGCGNSTRQRSALCRRIHRLFAAASRPARYRYGVTGRRDRTANKIKAAQRRPDPSRASTAVYCLVAHLGSTKCRTGSRNSCVGRVSAVQSTALPSARRSSTL